MGDMAEYYGYNDFDPYGEGETDTMATATKNAFGKPKAAKGDGTFEFKLPENMGSGRGRIPKGKYIGRCTSITADTSKSSGNPMWVWEFVITKGPHAGRDFKLWTVLTDDAAWKVSETLQALGIKVTPGEKIKINKKDVIGVGVTMHIKDDAGQDGDGEFSKLDKVSAHPSGAGFKGGSGISADASDDEDDEDLDDESEDAEDEDIDEEDDDEDDLDDEDDDDFDDEEDEDDDDLLDDEDEEDNEEEPAPRAAAKKTAAKKPAAKKTPVKKAAAKKTGRR